MDVTRVPQGAEHGDMATEVSLWHASDQASKVCPCAPSLPLPPLYFSCQSCRCCVWLLSLPRLASLNDGWQVVAFGKNVSVTCVYDRCCLHPPTATAAATTSPLTPHPPTATTSPLTPHPRTACSCTLLYSNFTPLVIILVGKRGVNVGLLHALLPEIRLKLESMRSVVGNA